MKRSRDNKSRFGPPNNYGPSNAAPIMNLKTGMPRNYGDSIFSTQNVGSSGSSSYKSPEQIAFDNEFKKWQKSFDDWKQVYAHHPDRQAYREYERKFLDVREKLLEKRKQIYGDNNGRGDPFIEPFQNQLFAADAMANSILSKFDDPRDFRDDDNYRGGYERNSHRDMDSRERFGNSRGSFGESRGGFGDIRGNFGDNRGGFGDNRGRDGGRDRMRNDNRRDGGRNDRSGGRGDRSFGNNRSMGRGDGRFGNDRSMGRGDGRFGNQRRIQKPTQEQLMKDLKRRDVYPHNRWILINKDDRPALVGKRAKKKNSKIQNVIERKRKIADGEVPLEELPFSEKIDKLFEMARVTDPPKLLPGSMNRRVKSARNKKDEELTADERKLLAYCDYVSAKRQKYYEGRDKAEGKNVQEGEQAQTPMEQEEVTPA